MPLKGVRGFGDPMSFPSLCFSLSFQNAMKKTGNSCHTTPPWCLDCYRPRQHIQVITDCEPKNPPPLKSCLFQEFYYGDGKLIKTMFHKHHCVWSQYPPGQWVSAFSLLQVRKQKLGRGREVKVLRQVPATRATRTAGLELFPSTTGPPTTPRTSDVLFHKATVFTFPQCELQYFPNEQVLTYIRPRSLKDMWLIPLAQQHWMQL